MRGALGELGSARLGSANRCFDVAQLERDSVLLDETICFCRNLKPMGTYYLRDGHEQLRTLLNCHHTIRGLAKLH